MRATIETSGRVFKAAACADCGVKIYPPSAMAIHAKRHAEPPPVGLEYLRACNRCDESYYTSDRMGGPCPKCRTKIRAKQRGTGNNGPRNRPPATYREGIKQDKRGTHHKGGF